MAKHISRNISYISGSLWLMGFGLLAAVSIIIAISLPVISPDASGIVAWAQQHRIALQAADEMLAFGALMILAAVVLLYSKLKERRPVGISIVLALCIVVTISAFHTMMALGRLVYPVNGLPIIHETTLLSASQMFAGLHWMALALAAFVIAMAIITKSRMIIITSVCAALLKIVDTYYAGGVSVPLTVASEVVLFGWSIMIASWIFRKRFESNVFPAS